jgi:hypothetical protein
MRGSKPFPPDPLPMPTAEVASGTEAALPWPPLPVPTWLQSGLQTGFHTKASYQGNLTNSATWLED